MTAMFGSGVQERRRWRPAAVNEALASLRSHWTHYASEAAGLGIFMFVAGSVAVVLLRLPAPMGRA
jgi:hypothetical protein